MDDFNEQEQDPFDSLLLDHRFLPTYPFDLKESLKIRDGLKKSKSSAISRHLLQEMQIRSLKNRDICPN